VLHIGGMTNPKQHHKPVAHKRMKPPPSVELKVSKHTFDVDAWLGKYVERTVDREVHSLADRGPAADAAPETAPRVGPNELSD
jgi:hypothetical protein